MVEVYKALSKHGQPIAEIISQFLDRGTYTDYENTFQRKIETIMQVHIGSSKDAAGLRSKEWSHLYYPDTELTESNASDEGVLTTYITVTPSLTPSKEVHIQTSKPSTPTTLVASTIRYDPPRKLAPKQPMPAPQEKSPRGVYPWVTSKKKFNLIYRSPFSFMGKCLFLTQISLMFFISPAASG